MEMTTGRAARILRALQDIVDLDTLEDYGCTALDGQTFSEAMQEIIEMLLDRKHAIARQPHHFVTVDLLIVHIATQSVLLIQRKKPPFKGLWALPGGHVEVDLQETLEQAARRELREETGLDCSEWPLHQVGAFGDPGRDPRGAYVSILYVALAHTPEQPVVQAGDDAGAVTWFPLRALPPLAFDHAQMVQRAVSTQFVVPPWRRCEKITPTRARPFTQADYEARNGIIETREGPAPFTVGDYLALDSQGEYPIRRETIEQHYVQFAPPDVEGWSSYRSTELREACQQLHSFATDCGATGLAGDYLLRGQNGRTWPCAKAKFECEYRFV